MTMTRIAAAPAVLLAALLLAPTAPARAAHSLDEEGGCYVCHSLNAAEAEPGTSAISSVSRTLPLMKAANRGVPPERFGCTYCHDNPANKRMKGVLEDFRSAWASRHPVGVTFTGKAPAETMNEYLSTVGSNAADELDCLDCHDVALVAPGMPDTYLGHADPAGPARAANPSMLKSVTVAGENDALCRSCHANGGVTVKGGKLVLGSHADAGAGGPLAESDGTHLKATAAGGNRQCTSCHDAHYSTLVRLFNDGHEGDQVIVGSKCTQVCHFPGGEAGYVDDRDNSYTRGGHGKPASTYKYRGGAVNAAAGRSMNMAMACTACHLSLDTGTLGPSRKPHVERSPAGATNAERYQKRFNIGLTVQEDPGSAFGNPVLGVCENCHATYEGHRGAGATAGCLDCHDEHAEGTGKANLFMIPTAPKPAGSFIAPERKRSGQGTVTYARARLDPATGKPREGQTDFFRADGAGICDNAECHPKSAPLSGFLKGGKHPGGALEPGADCGKCHPHAGSAGGSFTAK